MHRLASALASKVLPRPGTPSISTWPQATSATSVWSTSCCCPTTALATSSQGPQQLGCLNEIFWFDDLHDFLNGSRCRGENRDGRRTEQAAGGLQQFQVGLERGWAAGAGSRARAIACASRPVTRPMARARWAPFMTA